MEEEEPKQKRQITEKQREARLANLANGRKKRAAMIQQKKEKKNYEYDISSEEASFSSDSDGSSDFVISKKKARKDRKEPKKKERDEDSGISEVKSELNELRNIVTNMALLHKKTMKRTSSENRSKGSGTKVIVVPQQVSSQNKPTDDYMEKLRKSIFG